jgi:hypothetical protein
MRIGKGPGNLGDAFPTGLSTTRIGLLGMAVIGEGVADVEEIIVILAGHAELAV